MGLYTHRLLEKKKETPCIAEREKPLRITSWILQVVHPQSDRRVGSEGRRERWGTQTMALHIRIESRPIRRVMYKSRIVRLCEAAGVAHLCGAHPCFFMSGFRPNLVSSGAHFF